MEYTSLGKGNAALTTGIIGTALGGLNAIGGNLGGILGGIGNAPACHENQPVNRYEAAQSARIAELETEVKLRDANIYSDQKSLALYQYVDSQLRGIRDELCKQAVHNQRTEDSFLLMRQDLQRERDERCCGDNAIVNYANATFYPKLVANVTTGTETTAQSLYNPLPSCGCCK